MTQQNTVLAGLIGAGIQASRTPALHEHEGDAQGVRYLYRLIDLDQLQLDSNALPDLLLAAERMNFTGLNITFPCKQSIIPLLDELSPEARGIGEVRYLDGPAFHFLLRRIQRRQQQVLDGARRKIYSILAQD